MECETECVWKLHLVSVHTRLNSLLSFKHIILFVFLLHVGTYDEKLKSLVKCNQNVVYIYLANIVL